MSDAGHGMSEPEAEKVRRWEARGDLLVERTREVEERSDLVEKQRARLAADIRAWMLDDPGTAELLHKIESGAVTDIDSLIEEIAE